MSRPVSPWGYLALLAWSIALALLLPPSRIIWLLGALLLAAAILAPPSLRVLRQSCTWWLIAVLCLSSALWLGPKDRQLGPLLWSSEGAITGLGAGARLIALLLSTSLARETLPLSSWIRLFSAFRLPGLGFALGVALNLLPTLQRLAESTLQSIRLRGGLRRPWLALQLFLLTMVSNAISYGDQVVAAATCRAFDPAAQPTQPLRTTRGDGVLALAMSILTCLWVFI